MASFDARAGTASLWLVAVAALVAVIGWETDWGRRMAPLPVTPSAVAQPVAVALLPEYKLDGGVEARRETVERPAFVPTRRPAPATPPPEAAKPRMQRGQFVLTGTAVVDQQATAFLREAASGKSRTAGWIATVADATGKRQIDPGKSYLENKLAGEVEIDWGPSEGGGG